jgi:hypothetical protein
METIIEIVTSQLTGMDNGTMGEELLHQFYCWFKQWKLPCGHVQRLAHIFSKVLCINVQLMLVFGPQFNGLL